MSKKMKLLATIMVAGIIVIGSLGVSKGVDTFAMQMEHYDEDGNAIDQQTEDGMYGIHQNYNYHFLNPEKTEVEITDYIKYIKPGDDKLDFIEYPTELMGAKVTALDFDTQWNVKRIEIPNTVETVRGIDVCKNIETLVIPKNVKNFYSGFGDCEKLKTVTIYKETNITHGTFNRCPKDFIVYAEKGSTAELYAVAAGIKCINIDANGNVLGDANMEELTITKDQKEFYQYCILNKNLKNITIFKETNVSEFEFDELNKNIIIYCEKDSTAEKEAKRAGLKIVTIDENGNEIKESPTEPTPEEPSTPEIPQEPGDRPSTTTPDSTITPTTTTPDTTTTTPEQPPKKTGDITSAIGIIGALSSSLGLIISKKKK